MSFGWWSGEEEEESKKRGEIEREREREISKVEGEGEGTVGFIPPYGYPFLFFYLTHEKIKRPSSFYFIFFPFPVLNETATEK